MTPRRLVLAVALVGLLVMPHAMSPSSVDGQEPRTTREKQAEVRRKKGEVKVQVDLLKAKKAEVDRAVAALAANVQAQKGQVEEAQRAAAAASEDVVEATAAVAAAEQRITALDQATDEFITQAFLNPPSDSAFDALLADSINDASLKQTLLDIQADSDADVLDQLNEAHEDLGVEKANKDAVLAEAEVKRANAEEQLAQLQAAQAQQAAFATEAEAALDHKLTEANNLANLDAQLSRQIAAEQAALARAMEAARREGRPLPAGPGTIRPVPGGLASLSCAGGGALTVAGDIADGVRALMDSAADEGLVLCGWGYRSAESQIDLRRRHCGSSDYDIWHKPSVSCSPPTARPGFSMHEQGLAVDFTCDGGGIGSRSNACFRFLSRHAKRHGLYNLPSEPWHWSTNGN